MNKLFTVMTVFLLSSPFALAETYLYNCECTENNNGDKTLRVSAKEVVVTNLDESYGEVGAKFSAEFDPSYRPRPSRMTKLRYVGGEDGNGRKVIIQSTLLAGAAKGFMQLQGDEDGFWSSNFNCKLEGN